MSNETKGFDYPIAFLNEIDIQTKNRILKDLIDMCFDDMIDVHNIPIPKLKKAFVDLLIEANEAAEIMTAKLEMAEKAIIKDMKNSRKQRRVKTADERAKDAGLVVLKPNVPGGKLII